ncbi:MAG TPA: acetyl-CoA C-acyltransferase [Rubricoccaceae bacterium]|nr:acetyl-CoA C-acyltransferase [Rubricoccaceae bacterium]
MQLNEAYIVSSVRTPVGKAKRGALRNVRPEYMGAVAVKGALARVPGLAPEQVDDVIVGCAFPEGPQGLNMGRVIAQMAGLPDTTPGATVNRYCSSGLQSIAQGVAAVALGQAECVVAGGVETMSLVPMGGFYYAPNPDLVVADTDYYSPMGITAENVAERYQVSREDQDAFALRSHQRAVAAIESGRFDAEIVPVPVREVRYDAETREAAEVAFEHAKDEGPRADTTLEALAKLKPAFRQGGTVTAGNASQMNDGAAMTVIMSKRLMEEAGATPLARMLGFAVAGVAPEVMGIGPVEAIPKLLRQTGVRLEEIDLIELNEAFASQSLAIIRELGLDEERVNVNGGAIAMGHPLGCTGAKLTATILHELGRRNGRYGLVTMCIGGGMGAAGLFERLN